MMGSWCVKPAIFVSLTNNNIGICNNVRKLKTIKRIPTRPKQLKTFVNTFYQSQTKHSYVFWDFINNCLVIYERLFEMYAKYQINLYRYSSLNQINQQLSPLSDFLNQVHFNTNTYHFGKKGGLFVVIKMSLLSKTTGLRHKCKALTGDLLLLT